jgi:glycosyltransferase involved in cell wall biosynthesis
VQIYILRLASASQEKDWMKILLSAFACDPTAGSEEGVGWGWAYNLARLGHSVCVLTRSYYRAAIEDAMRQLRLPTLCFEYIGVQHVPFWIPGPGVYPYYTCWQWNAYFRARQMHREYHFEVVHHITYSAFRNPSYLYLLRDTQFIFGPVGGGERSPRGLRVNLSRKGRRYEALRDLANLLPRVDPFWQSMLRHCSRIVVKTEETRACLPSKSMQRAVVCMENMVTEQPCLAGERGRIPPLKLFYAGRLLELKGLHLALRAMALVVGRERVELTIVGKGSEESRLKEDANRLNLNKVVHFAPWMSRAEVLEFYSNQDALLFPSLHDSGGTVVMEALARGKPVICLDLGGPPVTVDQYCARVVSTGGKTEEQVVQGMADAILELCRMTTENWDAMRRAAVRRAQFYSPNQVIARVYGPLIEEGVSGLQVDTLASFT